jgi:outer membrane protein OmpA-like peptidoglycan-associated protein
MDMNMFTVLRAFSLLLLTSAFNLLFAQVDPMKVARCLAVETNRPIRNVHVDENNQKFIGDGVQVWALKAIDLAELLKLEAGERSLLAYAGGNADIRWKADDLNKISKLKLDAEEAITCGYYEAKRDVLWLGTAEHGLFELKTKPQLQIVATYNKGNSRFNSNHVTNIFVDKFGKFWIGTEEGLLSGQTGKFDMIQPHFNVQRIQEYAPHVYVLAEGDIWRVNSKNKWETVELDSYLVEGAVSDLSIDDKGRLWIASEILCRFDLELDQHVNFGPAQYYTSQLASFLKMDQDGALWAGTADKGLYLVEKADAMTVNCLVEKDLNCAGNGQDAAVKAKVTGGKAPYKYAWSSGAQTEALASIGPGDYTISVTDATGLQKTGRVKIADPRITLELTQVNEESGANAADGAANVVVKGGSPIFTYLWDNGENTQQAKKLKEGAHSVTVTDKRGCKGTGTINISQKLGALKVVLAQNEKLKCPGDKNVTLKAQVTGGKGPYQYQWSNGNNTEQSNNLAAAEYKVTITDANGQKAETSLMVEQPQVISPSIKVEAPASIGGKDGKASVQITGGTAPYTYAWSNGERAQAAIELPAGMHSLKIVDANGCQANVNNIEITENILPLTAVLKEKSPLRCTGDRNGILAVELNGGKAPFTYKWEHDGKLDREEANGLTAASYQVSVTDATGKSVVANAKLQQPEPLEVKVSIQGAVSAGNNDGKATMQATGGDGKYTYQWDNGESTAMASKLGPGRHTASVTDGRGCSTTASIQMIENILPMNALISLKTGLNCNGDKTAALAVEVNGGKAPFTYQWNTPGLSGNAAQNLPAGDYQVNITDATGKLISAEYKIANPAAIQLKASAQAPTSTGKSDGKALASANGGTGALSYKWDNGETTATATTLAPGKHRVSVTDSKGCSNSAEVEISENVLPLAINMKVKKELNCADEKTAALQVEVSGGKAPFSFQWSEADAQGEQPSGLGAGDYLVTVSDASGKSASGAITINAPEALSASINILNNATTGEKNGQAQVQVFGGLAPYVIKWSNGDTKEKITGLAVGKISVVVTDSKGCKTEKSADVEENILPLRVVKISTKTEPNCPDDKTGALAVEVSGGKKPYNFQWNTPDLSGQEPAGVAAGTYLVTVNDASGKTATGAYTLAGPAPISVKINVITSASANQANGKATAVATGGNGNLVFKWDSGEAAATASTLTPGKHSVTVSDRKGCSSTATVDITENILPLEVKLAEKTPLKCFGANDAKIVAEVQGGKGPFKYQWSKAGESNPEAQVGVGEYQVTVTDAAGAQRSSSIVIKQPEQLSLSLARKIGASAESNADGSATIQAKGGNGTLNFSWDSGETLPTARKLSAGQHKVTVTDANGCSVTGDVTIGVKNIPELNAAQLRNGQAIRIEKLQFDTDSTRLKDAFKPILDEVYDFLMDNPNVSVEIGGHTNGLCQDDFCNKLSTTRAKSVADYLISKGVEAKRVLHKGYGRLFPIATNSTPEGRLKNQRVEIKILRMGG